MIRLRDISLPPAHNAHQLTFEAAKMLRLPNSKIKQLRLVRRSVDARKKPDVRIIYTVDVAVEGNEQKILKQSGCILTGLCRYRKRNIGMKNSYYKII